MSDLGVLDGVDLDDLLDRVLASLPIEAHVASLGRHPLSSPAAFAASHSYGAWLPYRHLRLLSDEVMAGLERDEWDVLVVTTPPRHGKTEFLSRWLPAWYVIRHRGRVGLASYEADFAATHGRRAREIIADAADHYRVGLAKDSSRANRWELDDGSGAGMWTAGAGGPITGKGFNLGIIDDPIKNADEARSPVYRDRVWDWWQTTFLTRREPGAKVIVVMTRWHEDDLVGRLAAQGLARLRIRTVNLPAIAESDDPIGRAPGEPLCPERYDLSALSSIREALGSAAWNALYQQRPQRLGGNVFRRDDFRYFRTTDTGWYLLRTPSREVPIQADRCWRFATMDPAYTKGRRSDFTVLATYAVAPTDPPSLLLLNGQRVKVEGADHAPMVERVWHEWEPAWIGVEKSLGSLTLFAPLQRRGVVVRPLRPDANKGARAETAAAVYEAGRVYHPAEAPWLHEWEDELLGFPAAPHDDVVDATAYACIELAGGRVHAKGRRGRDDKGRIATHLEALVKRGHRQRDPVLESLGRGA